MIYKTKGKQDQNKQAEQTNKMIVDIDTLIENYKKRYVGCGGLCFSPPKSPGTIDSNQFTAPKETGIKID